MNQPRAAGVVFVSGGLLFLTWYFIGNRGNVWLALGVAFMVLGAARLTRTPKP